MANQTVVSGACGATGTTVALPASATDQRTLISILPYLSFSATGIGGKPTLRVTKRRLQQPRRA